MSDLTAKQLSKENIALDNQSDAQSPFRPGDTLGRLGDLDVRLIKNESELEAAQRLRYQIFFDETLTPQNARSSSNNCLDIDEFDAVCDHLVVIDKSKDDENWVEAGKIVGTYRLLRQESAARHGAFYTEGEYDLQPLLARHKNRRFLELGRSCVLPEYRTKRTVELLWHGIWAYVLKHKIDVMFGCACLNGTNVDALSDQLSALSNLAKAPDEWCVKARPERYVDMGKENAVTEIRKSLGALPPLIKGYLRLGAYIGDGAVIDYEFGTTDVLIVLPVENINPRYLSHYGEDAGRYAA